MRRAWVGSLALLLASTPATGVAAPARVAPLETGPRAWANVAVDTSEVGEAGPAVRRRVQERADVVLRGAGILPGRGPADPTIRVIVRELGGDRPGWDYVVTLAPEHAQTPAFDRCSLCTETELVDAIEGRLAILAAELDDATVPAATPRSHDPPPPATPATPTRRRPMRATGIALLSLGGAALVTGAVLAARPARPKPGEPLREIYTQPPGYALLASGGAALVVGLVLLLVVHRARPAGPRTRAHGPRATATAAGLLVRF